MSYILDALRKSEQERQRRQVPGAAQVLAPASSKPRRWLWVLMAALVVQGAAVVWWLGPWRQKQVVYPPERAVVSAPREEPGARGAVPTESVPSVTKRPAQAQLSPAGTAQQRQGKVASANGEQRPLQRPLPHKAEKEGDREVTKTAAVSATEPAPSVAVEKQDPEPIVPGDAAKKLSPQQVQTVSEPLEESPAAPREPVAVAVAAPAQPPSRNTITPATVASSTPPAPKNSGQQPPLAPVAAAVPTLDQLSPRLQEEIGPLHLSVHFYAHNPRRRKVSINGRMMRQKEYVRDGLRLEEITRDGALFSFRKKRFRVPVF